MPFSMDSLGEFCLSPAPIFGLNLLQKQKWSDGVWGPLFFEILHRDMAGHLSTPASYFEYQYNFAVGRIFTHFGKSSCVQHRQLG